MMSPDERRMISDLFDRVREAERNPRDRDAEALIAQRAREAPNAAYTLAQVVLVQEQALGAAQRRIEELEDQLREAERAAPAPAQQGGFLGGLGSLFGGGQPAPSRYAPQAGPDAPGPAAGPWSREAQRPSRYAPPQPGYDAAQPGMAQGGPWGGQAAAPARTGGGFLAGALGAAAGVAGGMLLANSIQGLFKSDPHLAQTAGHDASGVAAADLQNLPPLDAPAADQGYAQGDPQDGYQDASYDDGGYDDGGYGDGGSDV